MPRKGRSGKESIGVRGGWGGVGGVRENRKESRGEDWRGERGGGEMYLRVLLGALETLGLEPDLICFLKADILSCVLENFLLPEKQKKTTCTNMLKLILREKH